MGWGGAVMGFWCQLLNGDEQYVSNSTRVWEGVGNNCVKWYENGIEVPLPEPESLPYLTMTLTLEHFLQHHPKRLQSLD